jgi:PAS domain S-box-containing protein
MNSDFLTAVLERADVALVACDLNGKVSVMNAAARTLFGGATLPDTHPVIRALQGKTDLGVEVVTGDGSSVLVRADPLFDAQGNRIGVVATCAAVSPRREDGEEARKRLELVLNSTGEGIFGIDMQAIFTFINGSAAAMFGRTPAEMLGQSMHVLTHHTDKHGQPYPMVNCPIFRACQAGSTSRVDDEYFFRADGSSFPVEYASYPFIDAGTVRGAVVTFSDLTARKKMEAVLHNAEAKYRTLFDTISEGIYQTSVNGELLAANRALVEMLGYNSENELRSQDVNQLYVNPEDRKRYTAQLERDGKLEDAPLLLKRKDGRVIHVLENGRTIHDDRKRVVYFEGTLTLAR